MDKREFEVYLPDKKLIIEDFKGDESTLKEFLKPHIPNITNYTFTNLDNVWEEVDFSNPLPPKLKIVPLPENDVPNHSSKHNRSEPEVPSFRYMLQLPTEKIEWFLQTDSTFINYFKTNVGHFLKTYNKYENELDVFYLCKLLVYLLSKERKHDTQRSSGEPITLLLNQIAIQTILHVEDAYGPHSRIHHLIKHLMRLVTVNIHE